MWIIQCKHYLSRSVAVRDFQDTIVWADSHNPEGILIITSNFLSSDAKNYIKELYKQKRYKIEYIEIDGLEKIIKNDIELINKYFSGMYNYDRILVVDANVDDLDEDVIRWFVEKRGTKIGNLVEKNQLVNVLRNINAVEVIDRKTIPTVAGILIFGKNPQRFIPHSIVQIARFKGAKMGDIVEMEKIDGHLTNIIDKCEEFIKRHTKRIGKVGFRTEETFMYPIEAIGEAIINAIAHRDYSLSGRNIRVMLFDDRIEIENPGGLPADLTIKNFEGRHFARNEVIAQCLYDAKYMQKFGTGIGRMKELMRRRGLPDPLFKDEKNTFSVTFYNEEMVKGREELENIKRVIEMSKVDIGDFVGRKDIIKNFPAGDVFIQGKAAFGKTYLMLMLSRVYNGYYIPLGIVKEKEIFELLVSEGKKKNKRIFIDDFHLATQEIKEYIQAYVSNVVLASREEPTMRRDFNRITLHLLNGGDIREYFSIYSIGIEEKTLKLLEDNLDFPIKLRIFVDYLNFNGIKYLDKIVLKTILEDLGMEKFKLPDELNDFYKKFVFGFFDENQIQLCYVLSLLRFPASVGRLSEILNSSEGEVSKLLEKMLGVLEVRKNEYTIFHESFREFCLLDLGNARELNKRIGTYFKGLMETQLDLEARIEGMYHFRVSESKDDFKKVFDLSMIQFLIDVGRWIEAEENLKFGLGTSIDEKKKADTTMILGTIYHEKGDWKKAMIFYKNCQKIYKKLENIHGMAQTYNNLGLVYVDKGEWDKAIKYYEKSLEILEELGDVHGMAQAFGNLGSAYADKGEWDKAIKYYEKSLEILEELGDVHGAALTKYGIANILSNKQKLNDALELYLESKKTLKKLGDKLNLMFLYYNLAMCCEDMKQEGKATEYYQRAEELRKQLGIENP